MSLHKRFTGVLWGGLLLAMGLGGCAKVSELEVKKAETKNATVAQAGPAALSSAPDVSDPATLLSYKTGVDREKVQEILAIYEASAATAESGRDVYKIALFASEKTGLATSQVGSVILGYKAMGGESPVSAAVPGKAEPKKG